MTIESELEEKKYGKNQIISLEFDCYNFYKFIETLEKYTDEVELVFENREFSITFMDASRIMICKCIKSLDNLTTIEKMKFGVNVTDLMKLLKTRKTDKKEIKLTFDNTKTHIEFVKTSEKYHSKITRTLELIDLERETIPMDNLDKIEYLAKATFPIKFLDDFFYEASIYSEIVEIEITEFNNIGISFSEEGQIGNSKYLIEGQYCDELKGNRKGSYAYSFLTPIKPLLKILNDNDKITLHINNDHPIKLKINISSLDIDMLIYLAPRVEETDFDDWNEEEDEF